MAYDKMQPKLILVPKSDCDVRQAIKFARRKGVNIAIRTGGHQYSGASSTGGKNIQLDMSEAYRDTTKDFVVEQRDGEQPIVRVGISFTVSEFFLMMADHGIFVPAGQCGYTCS